MNPQRFRERSTMMDRFEKFNYHVSTWLEWIGLVAILLMVMITCVDVIGAKVFLRPVFGAIDIVMLAQLIAISFAAGATMIVGKHIEVEFFVVLFPKRLQSLVAAFIHLLGVALFAVIVWRLILYGYSLQITGEVSSTARIPLHFFAYGVALASAPICLILARNFVKSIRMVGNK